MHALFKDLDRVSGPKEAHAITYLVPDGCIDTDPGLIGKACLDAILLELILIRPFAMINILQEWQLEMKTRFDGSYGLAELQDDTFFVGFDLKDSGAKDQAGDDQGGQR